jgi:hypothetical protein
MSSSLRSKTVPKHFVRGANRTAEGTPHEEVFDE